MQIHLISTIRSTWRTVRRTCVLILGLEGLNKQMKRETLESKSFKTRNQASLSWFPFANYLLLIIVTVFNILYECSLVCYMWCLNLTDSVYFRLCLQSTKWNTNKIENGIKTARTRKGVHDSKFSRFSIN